MCARLLRPKVGPHNLYNMMDFCPTAELSLDQWNAALMPNPDGSLRRMDEPLHQATKLFGNTASTNLPLGERQR